MQIWIVLYEHRHGADVWPVNFPITEEQVANELDDYEPDRDETIEVVGPFDVSEDRSSSSKS